MPFAILTSRKSEFPNPDPRPSTAEAIHLIQQFPFKLAKVRAVASIDQVGVRRTLPEPMPTLVS